MLPAEREMGILSLINERGTVTVRELSDLFEVTEVTIRRDLQRMEGDALLRRTHGGAMALQAQPRAPEAIPDSEPHIDALIIAPINNRAAYTLREKAIRNRIPLISESSPTQDAIYLGCHNYEVGLALGEWVSDYIRKHFSTPVFVLDIGQSSLHNTRERSRGFLDGLQHSHANAEISVLSVDGQGLYTPSYQIATDALRSQTQTNIIFGINDDALLGGLQAYRDLGHDENQLLAVNIGGEGNTIFDELSRGMAHKACAALFPELVGRMGIDALAYLWANQTVGEAITTPYRLITAANLTALYRQTANGWLLHPDVLEQIVDEPWSGKPPEAPGKRVSFVIHYRTHEWYQNVYRAMATRAAELEIEFSMQDVAEDLATEVRSLKRLIGKMAAAYIEAGETVIFDAGSTTNEMTLFLPDHKQIIVITNSLDVQARLATRRNIQLLLTGGQYDAETKALVGRGSQLFLQELRADKVFLVAGGLSTGFGLSSVNAHEADVRRQMIRAAKEVIVLADHTVIDVDANMKVCDIRDIHTIITDSGIRPEQRLAFTQLGIHVRVAGLVSDKNDT